VGESLLRQIRQSRGMTQKEVALAIGMQQSTYCLIEHGKRPADWCTVQKLCDLFEIDHSEVFVPKRFAVRKSAGHM